MDDLDRWTPVSVLGTGAFGQVHLAWDRTDRRWVALKRFTGQDELGLLRFVIESRIRVDHPHLVRSLAFRLVDDDAVLVTELARGGSLRQLMTRHGALPAPWVAAVVGQVLDALATLHAHGVVHRDLKPANLLLRDAGAVPPHVLVADFGIATWRTVSLTGVGAAIGTPGYLAPEYLDAGTPSPKSDLFAVGVLAAELLAGQRLVHQSNSTPDIPADWSTQLPMPGGLAPKLAAVLRRMADPDPAARYPDCAEAAEALRHALPGAPGVVPGIDLLDGLPAGWTADGPADAPVDAPTAVPPPVSTADWTQPVTRRAVTGPPTPAPGLPTPPPGTPPPGTAPWPAPPVPLPPKKRRRAPWLAAAAVLAVLVGAGIIWAVTANHTTPGGPTPTGTGHPAAPQPAWTPEPLAQCALAERGAERTIEGRSARCQRTSATRQDWVAEPAGGFPVSNPSGPFPGEACGASPDTDYSPTGVPLTCVKRKWTARA
ncbi:serine/threonine-protein kinase [Labedaea rhizosphaerae]|uniref:non-specific serine/threonine protein kinase n=1 Tax=Labedaea rhizosphaerae TaxID=598644 RepID=A0A4R6SCY0_LABRH|nr:serine/threonine-protein kinase [Labedaea rhizosphaerae]TDP97447.1 serine/threonine-protein kinase [Labedaea rhizosphaerae]